MFIERTCPITLVVEEVKSRAHCTSQLSKEQRASHAHGSATVPENEQRCARNPKSEMERSPALGLQRLLTGEASDGNIQERNTSFDEEQELGDPSPVHNLQVSPIGS